MRLLSRLVIALIICLVAFALSAVPAQAQCYGPVIRLSPGSGVPGTQLIVQGQSFTAGKYIDIYYDGTLVSEGTQTSPTGEFSILFTVPEGCRGDHPVLVEVGSDIGTITKESSFYVTPGLTASPNRGPEGTNVTVSGHGFIGGETGIELRYYTGEDTYQRVARDIKADDSGHWETTFQVPASTRGEHKMDAQGSFSQSYDVQDTSFKVTAGIAMDRSSVDVGDSVTMTGSRFAPYEQGIQILFDGQPVVAGIKADGEGNWEETFNVPGMPTGNHTVTAEGEYTPAQDVIALTFEVASDIMLSPTEGYVGMNVIVTGHGLAADKSVSIMYDGDWQTTAETDGQGGFEASFSVPQGRHGEHQVTIGYSSANVASATFTLESDPPDTPQLVSPSDGSRMGLRGTVTPTFQWSAVTDDSGVTYSFQMATSPDVTAAGEFITPLISVTDLTATNYTAMDALPHGTYYWIVQAVDGAQNPSGWTAPHVLRVGLLPPWAFIAIIVAIAAAVIAVIVAVVRRRRYYY